MKIILNNLIPKPLLDGPKVNSEVWLLPLFSFSEHNKYLIYSQSGKGKTSLLSIIYGLRTDYEGVVLINGNNIRELTRNNWVSLRRNKISMLFQGLNLFDQLTVKENIMLKNTLTDFATESNILSWLDEVGIKSLYHKKVSEISYGQKQRVAIVRALCQPFELLMLDEPFSHIDEENRQHAFSLVSTAVEEQKAILILSSLNDKQYIDFQKYRI